MSHSGTSTPSILFLIHSLAKAGSKGEKAWEKGKFLASTRIQLGPALAAAQHIGMSPIIRNIRSENPDHLNSIGKPKLCIFGKLSHPELDFAKRISIANLAAISILKQREVPIIVTYSDNLASHEDSPIAELYRTLLWHANAVIYPCKAMQKLGKKWYNKKEIPSEWIIEDPCQVTQAPYPELKPEERCRVIWFGHSSNALYLINKIPLISKKCNAHKSFELTVLSDTATAKKVHKCLENSQKLKNWTFRFKNWDISSQPKQLQEELGRAHIAIIPSDPQNLRKSAASHNRAVDAIQAGCMTIASPIESYMEISKLLLISENFATTMNQGISQYSRLTKKWSALRGSNLKRFSPNENSKKWQQLIKSF